MINNSILNSKKVNPYYIYAPSYTHYSAGVKVMHFLCHHLNLQGYPAFLIRNGKNKAYNINSDLITPILDNKVLENHERQKKTPIVIYSDNIKGNPINAQCIVRYLLHYAGFLGGDKTFPKDTTVFSYTRKIAEESGFDPSQILFMPASDTKIFYPPKNGEKRSGSCFYAAKYRWFFKGELFDITKDSLEITRDLPDSQTTEEVAEIFRKSEVFYCYEDSSLITEASLCGCPVMLIKNEFFSGKTLAEYELGTYDCYNESNLSDVVANKDKVNIMVNNFHNAINNFLPQLENFIKITQDVSRKNTGLFSIKIPQYKKRMHIGRALRNILFNK